MNILIVEDDQDISAFLKRGFEQEGYKVDCVSSGEEAIGKVAVKPYETVILDVMLPRRSGLDVCKDIRDSGNDLTVIMLSARDAVQDRVEGLSTGADDYVVKPFEFTELLARVRANERRGRNVRGMEGDKIDAGCGLLFNPAIRKLETDKTSVWLTKREADLLDLFIKSAGRPLSRMDIFAALWADDGGNSINVVDVYVGYLRRKLATLNVPSKSLVKTVRGEGFMYDPYDPS